MIGIRVDANDTVAFGHITRCLSVAVEIKKAVEKCIFFTVEKECASLAEEAGFSCILLKGRYDAPEEELPELLENIKKYRIKSLLIDSYYVTKDYFKALSGACALTYFDELYFKGFGFCRNLINGILTPPSYEGISARALTGPDYVALREEFQNLPPKTISGNVKNILITSGGSDPYHFIRTILDMLEKEASLKGVRITAVTGKWNADKEELSAKYASSGQITVLPQTPEFLRYLSEADLVITAGGMTLYEACACGTPGICFSMSDNQVRQSEEFGRAGYLSYAGDLRNGSDAVIRKILAFSEQYKDFKTREEKSRKMQQLVDGKGASRIAAVLIQEQGTEND